MPPKKTPGTNGGKQSKRPSKKVDDDSDASFDDTANDIQDEWEDADQLEDVAPATSKKGSKPGAGGRKKSGKKVKSREEMDREAEVRNIRSAEERESTKKALKLLQEKAPQFILDKKKMPGTRNSQVGYVVESFLAWANAGFEELEGPPDGHQDTTGEDKGKGRAEEEEEEEPIPPRPFDVNFIPTQVSGSYVSNRAVPTSRGPSIVPRPFQVDMQPYLQWLDQNHTRLQQAAVDAVRAAGGEATHGIRDALDMAGDAMIEAQEQLARLNLGTAQQYDPAAAPEASNDNDTDSDTDIVNAAADGYVEMGNAEEVGDEIVVVETPAPRGRGNRGRAGGRGRSGGRGGSVGRGRDRGAGRGRGRGRDRGSSGGKSRGV